MRGTTCGVKPEAVRAIFLCLLAGCFGAFLASCDSPDVEIDAETENDAEVLTIEPALIGSAHVPYSMTTSVALLDEHTACTIDTYETKIDCVTRSGAITGRFGSTGEGPGEFVRPSRLVRGSGGTLGVTDPARGRFFAFTRTGELVAEVSLPVPAFIPAAAFDTTIIGSYISGYGPDPTARGGMAAAEILLATGELVREWRPTRVPQVPECGMPYFGFPAVGGFSGDQSWVFMACNGHIAFVEPDGETTVIEAPTYAGDLPGERDLEEHRNVIGDFRRRNGITTDLSGSIRRFAERPMTYFLGSGQETFDSQGRLWISTRRNRNEASFVDIYAGTEYVGTVKVRDRMIDFDVFEGTLAVLVERQAGSGDADGIPDRGIDWYDLDGF